MKKANLTVGAFVEVPFYCFAPERRGWNGWLFALGQIVKVGKTPSGKQAAVVEYYHNGVISKVFAADKVFDASLKISLKQQFINGLTDEEYQACCDKKELEWLVSRGAIIKN